MTAGDRAELGVLDHTFLFADLAGFTALTEAMGDEEAANLAGDFSDTVRRMLADQDAELVKAIGDASMVRAGDAAQAVRLALRIVHEVGAQHLFPIVRVGMHSGTAVERGGDWFGATVNVAARVSGLAGGGEVLLTDATRNAAGAIEGVELRERGRQQVKNVAEPLLLYTAVRESGRTTAGLPLDPVCRMAVDPARAAGKVVYDGVEYHFCSLECVRSFATAPERYRSYYTP